MLHEYAVEPSAIGADFETFRYVIEQFGFDKGRIIAEFPRRDWFKEVYKAAEGFPPTQRSRLEVLLDRAKGTKVVRTGRAYDKEAGDWLFNALAQHDVLPFAAIIALANAAANPSVITTDEMGETHRLMVVTTNRAVARDHDSIASALSGFLRYGTRVVFVDPFFDPFNQKFKTVLRACLRIASGNSASTEYEIHYREGDRRPSPVEIEREAAHIFPDLIPAGMAVRIYCWREKTGGEDFHARYLLTDRGGIGIDAGFSAEGGHQSTDMYLMNLGLCKEKLEALSPTSGVYELVGPALLIDAVGRVQRV